MAIAPNVTFVSGNVLTAAQQNAFGFGIVALQTATTSDTTITGTEEIQITVSFTAIANRYYKITYLEPNLNNNVDANVQLQVRLTNVSGAIQGADYAFLRAGGFSSTGILIAYSTFTAGATTLVATLDSTVGTAAATRSADFKAFLSVEDVGPA